MNEVIPGILHWQARHPNIGVDVSSYLLLDSGTLLDPMLPEGAGRDWIGHQVERVILTVRHHDRSAGVFGVPVFVHRSGLHEFDGSGLDVRGYEAGDELARGISVLPFGRICPDDAVLKIDIGPGVLAFGDGLLNYGGLGHPPDRYIGDDPEAIKADIVEGLVPFVHEDFDVLLFASSFPSALMGLPSSSTCVLYISRSPLRQETATQGEGRPGPSTVLRPRVATELLATWVTPRTADPPCRREVTVDSRGFTFVGPPGGQLPGGRSGKVAACGDVLIAPGGQGDDVHSAGGVRRLDDLSAADVHGDV
jgi:hypothetical protein